MAGGGQVVAILMDLAKAFDKVNHIILLRKLSTFPLDPCLISLSQSYLWDRNQYVCVYGHESNSITPVSSVPQGSILSPLLFALYQNDLPSRIKSNVLLFADDMKIFANIKKHEDARILQGDIDTIYNWCENNQLQLNTKKCFTIAFTRKPIETTNQFLYKINGNVLQKVGSYY